MVGWLADWLENPFETEFEVGLSEREMDPDAGMQRYWGVGGGEAAGGVENGWCWRC